MNAIFGNDCVYIFDIYISNHPFSCFPYLFVSFFKNDKHLLKKTFSSQFSCGAVAGCSLMLSGETTTQIPFWRKNSIKCISLFMPWWRSICNEVNDWAPKIKKKSLRKLWQKNIWSSQQLRKWRYTLYFCQRNQTEPGWFLLAEVFHNISKVACVFGEHKGQQFWFQMRKVGNEEKHWLDFLLEWRPR